MKKLIWLTLAVVLASCNSSSKEEYSGGSLSFSASEVKINVTGYFENALNKDKDAYLEGFYYEYSEDEDGIKENFYTLSNYQNLENRVRVNSGSWNFNGAYFASDGTDLILNLVVNNLGANAINCSIEKLGDNWDERYSVTLPSQEIKASESKTLRTRFMRLTLSDSASINNGENALLMFKANKKPGQLIKAKESISKDSFTYDEFSQEPASDVSGTIYGRQYVNMLGDTKKDTIFQKNYTYSWNIDAFPHINGEISSSMRDVVPLNFVKNNYYFFALDMTVENLNLRTTATVRLYIDGAGSSVAPLYRSVSESRVVVIFKYEKDVTENVNFAICFACLTAEEVGTITYHSMLAVDLGDTLNLSYTEYEKELPYFSNTLSTTAEVFYIEGESETLITTFTYSKEKEYSTFTYLHKKDGVLEIRYSNHLTIDYSMSYLTYSYYVFD